MPVQLEASSKKTTAEVTMGVRELDDLTEAIPRGCNGAADKRKEEAGHAEIKGSRPVSKIPFKNILYLTDFSQPSEEALPFALSLARGYGAKLYALHVFMPSLYIYTPPGAVPGTVGAEEEIVKAGMQRLESQLSGVSHEVIVQQGFDVWPTVQEAIKQYGIDLLVLGTHGRTGADKMLLGSAAEEIFRRSPVPVLTIGPKVRGGTHAAGQFHRVLFATDFTEASAAAAPFTLSLARENQARMQIIHVMRHPDKRTTKDEKKFELTVAEAIHKMYDAVPKDVELPFPAEVFVDYGEPAERIVEAGKERGADVIVLGVRDAAGRMGAATHLDRPTAHKVVAYATCPVLTVRE